MKRTTWNYLREYLQIYY